MHQLFLRFPLICLLLRQVEAAITQQTVFYTAEFKLENIRSNGVLNLNAVSAWESVTSAFYADLYADLDLTNPILAPGVVMQVTSQEPYIASTSSNGAPNYGVTLNVEVVVTFRSEETANHNMANYALRIFDSNASGGLVYFSSYLSDLRQANNSFTSVNRMRLAVGFPRPTNLQSPIPTLPLPLPTNAPVLAPVNTPTTPPPTTPPPTTPFPTRSPTKVPTTTPTKLPSPSPTKAPTRNPTSTPTAMPSNNPTSSPSRSPSQIPTAMPTTQSPTRPGETRAPTTSPSKVPTMTPTIQFSTFFATNELVFENTTAPLGTISEAVFVQRTANYLTDYVRGVLRDNTITQVTVVLAAQRQVSRRRLQEGKPLVVEFDSTFQVRSSQSLSDAQSLINGAFATNTRRQNFRDVLVASGDPILRTIERVSLSTNNPSGGPNGFQEAPQTTDPILSTGAIAGIIGGCLFVIVMMFAIWHQSRPAPSVASQKEMPPSTGQVSGEEQAPRGRLDAEIIVDRTQDDVSTLEDPFFGTSLEERTCADKTASSDSVQQSYEMWKLLGKPMNTLLGATKEEAEEDETLSKVNRTALVAEDDASFEQVFGDMR